MGRGMVPHAAKIRYRVGWRGKKNCVPGSWSGIGASRLAAVFEAALATDGWGAAVPHLAQWRKTESGVVGRRAQSLAYKPVRLRLRHPVRLAKWRFSSMGSEGGPRCGPAYS